MITDWRHEACGVMTIGDREGRIVQYQPHTHDRYFFFLTTKYMYLIFNKKKTENPEFEEMRHGDDILTLQ